MAFDVVNEENVYTCVGQLLIIYLIMFKRLISFTPLGHPLKTDIANIISWMLNEDFTVAYSSTQYIQVIISQLDYRLLTICRDPWSADF